jgi:sigma-B regulation protein RsbU (phosphoserine phosphatase)
MVSDELKSTSDQHYRKQIYALLQVTRAINHNFSAEDLFSICDYILNQQLGYVKFAYCSFDEIWRWPICRGAKHEVEHIRPDIDLKEFKDISFLGGHVNSRLSNFDVVIPVQHKTQALAYLLIGEIKDNESDEHKQDLEFIQTICNIIAVAIENKRLFKDNLQQEMFKRELEMAKEVQAMLIPSSLPHDEHFDFSAFYKPMRQVGGDYYDFIYLNEDEILFCVADVSGKGVSAAILMANFQAYLRAMVTYMTSLSDFVTHLNERVVQSAKGEKFITMFIAKYSISKRELTYVNAGHNPPVLHHSNGNESLGLGTTGLGMLEKLYRLEVGQVHIPEESLLLCYTDGLVEQENDSGSDFGTEHLINFMDDNSSLKSEAFNKKLIEHLINFKGDQPYIDDIALLTCRFH